MAYEMLGSGSVAPTTGMNTLQTVFIPRPYVFAVNLNQLDTCVVELSVLLTFYASASVVWSTGSITVGPTTGVLSPVIPVERGADLRLNVVSGTTGGNVFWDVFAL